MPKHMTKYEALSQYYKLCDHFDAGGQVFDVVRPAIERVRLSARRLDWANEHECSGFPCANGEFRLTDDDQAKLDRTRETHERHVTDAFARLFDTDTLARIRIEFQGDPRGPAIRIHEKDGAQDVGAFW